MGADYKQKYLDLRAKLLDSTDVAYRLGYEEGMKKGQQAAQEMQEQQMMEQQAMEQQAMAEGGGMPPGAEGGLPPEMSGEEEVPQEEMGEEEGSEMDGHINELESLVAKGEKPSVIKMREAVSKISELRKSQKSSRQSKAEKITTSQKSFVDGILKKWDKDTKNVTDGLEEIIKESGLQIELDK